MIVFTFEILQIKRREALAIAAIGGGTWVLGYGVWMKKGRELFVGSYRSLHQTPISPIQFQQTMSHSDPSNRYSYTPTLNWNPQVHHYFLKAYGADHFSRISTALTYALRTLKAYYFASNSLIFIQLSNSQAPFSLLLHPSQHAQVHRRRRHPQATLARAECWRATAAIRFRRWRGESVEGVFGCCCCSNFQVWDSWTWLCGVCLGFDYGDAPPKEVIVSRKCAEAVLRGAQVSE